MAYLQLATTMAIAQAIPTAAAPTIIVAMRNSLHTFRGRTPRRVGTTLRLRARTLHRLTGATAAVPAPRAVTVEAGTALPLHVVTPAEAALRVAMAAVVAAAITVEAVPVAALTAEVLVAVADIVAVEVAVTPATEVVRTAVAEATRIAKERRKS